MGLGAQRSHASLSDDDEVNQWTDPVSGTRPSAATLAAAVAAALAFVALVAVSGSLPPFAWRADILVSMAIGVTLLALMVAGLLALQAPGTPLSRLLVVAGIGLVAAVAGSVLDVVVLADLGRIAFGGGVGLWLGFTLADLTYDVRIIVGLAVAVGLLDAASVFLPQGPTRLLLTKAPRAVPYFVVAFPTIGYRVSEAYSALGTSDVIFFGLYTAAAVAFRLRVRLTLAAMAASLVVTVALALYTRALPALPLLSAAFLLVNADLLKARWGTRSADGGDESRGGVGR